MPCKYYKVYTSTGDLFKTFRFSRSEVGVKFCLSNKLPADVGAAACWATLGLARLCIVSQQGNAN